MKSIHGLKHQTIYSAFGFTINIFGPETARHNDLALLRENDVNNAFRNLQIESNDNQYRTFGDTYKT